MYNLCQHILDEVPKSDYLGVTISNDLKWAPHIAKITGKAHKTLGFIRRNLKQSPQELRELAYFSMIRSVLDYCSAIWDPHLKKDIDSIEGVQRRAARFVKQDYKWDSSVTKMLQELNWSTLQDRRRETRLVLMYKIVNGVVAVPADDYLNRGYRRTRRNSQNYRQYSTKFETFRNSFIPRTITDWNKLPDSIINCDTVDSFKNRLADKVCY